MVAFAGCPLTATYCHRIVTVPTAVRNISCASSKDVNFRLAIPVCDDRSGMPQIFRRTRFLPQFTGGCRDAWRNPIDSMLLPMINGIILSANIPFRFCETEMFVLKTPRAAAGGAHHVAVRERLDFPFPAQ